MPKFLLVKHRVLLLRHTKSSINIDISLGILPFEEELVERSSLHQVASISIRLPTTEDLIIMKAVAHRPQDLQDIRDLVEIHPDLTENGLSIGSGNLLRRSKCLS